LLELDLAKKRDSFMLEVKMNIAGNACILGRNGSGKSTLLSLIAGLLSPDRGIIRFNGRDITRISVEERKVVLVTPATYLPNLDVNKHILWGINKGKIDKKLIDNIKSRLGVNYSGIVDRLSTGMRIRTAIATALLSDVELILVDEAFSFVDDKDALIEKTVQICKELKKQILFATQDESDSRHVEEVYLLRDGKAEKIK
jgi:ABC-type spermidine/putrescine transport systems, ATPase components